MDRLFSFSEQRFSSLTKRAQHKKCAELLKEIISGKAELFATYKQWCEWMREQKLQDDSQESFLNRYHHHLKKAELSVREHNLPFVHTQDKPTSAPILPITIYLDNIRSAHNVGSILRTTEAMALGQVALSPTTPTPTHKQVADTAMGTEKWISWSVAEDISSLPRPLIALETCENAQPLSEVTFPQSFTLVVGNEEYGCSKETLQEADHIVSIPLYGRKNSLNVANAFAIAAATITQQMR